MRNVFAFCTKLRSIFMSLDLRLTPKNERLENSENHLCSLHTPITTCENLCYGSRKFILKAKPTRDNE